MITVHQLEVRVGARLLMENVSFRVGPGDKIGLVGRNGAGKTTLTKVLAGDTLPAGGSVTNSGELGYLTGPVRNIRASRDGGKPRHSNYASIWKRQRDGSFKVVMDVGINTPSAVPFPAGFTRAPHDNRFTGDYDETNKDY